MNDEQMELVRRLYALSKQGLEDEALTEATQDIMWHDANTPLSELDEEDRALIDSQKDMILEEKQSALDGAIRRYFSDDYIRILS